MDALERLAPQLAAYLDHWIDVDDPVLSAMHQRADSEDFPIVGPVVGRFLYQLTLLTRPRRIFELGSGFGYSAFWFARALASLGHEGGDVTLTETSSGRLQLAQRFLSDAGLSRYCSFKHGDALAHLAQDFDQGMDLIFSDIDKEYYPASLPMIARKLRVGGVFVADNMLWKGRVLEPKAIKEDAATRGVRQLTEALFARDDFVTSILPLRDGLTLAIKIK